MTASWIRLLSVCALVQASCNAALAYEPAVNYELQCMGCHTPDGRGEPGRVPSVRKSLLRFSRTPAGRAFLVEVPGAAQSSLSDAELAAVLNWMLANLAESAVDRHFIAYTAAEVARYRRTPLIDVRGARKRLLNAPGGD